MLTKIKEFFMNKVANMKDADTNGMPMTFVYIMSGAVIFIVILYLIGWIYKALVLGKIELAELIALLSAIVAPQSISALVFFSKAFIDKNHNGIPDELEDKEESK